MVDRLLRRLALAWLVVVATKVARTAAASSRGRPPFVEHVSKEALQQALRVAAQRHRDAVQLALDHFPVDDTDTDDAVVDQAAIDAVQLKAYPLTAVSPDSLPDFGNELDTNIYVTDPPLFSREECASVIQKAEEHFQQTNGGEWTTQKSGQYQVAGFLLQEVPAVREWFIQTVRTKLFPILAKTFPDFCNAEDLCVDNSYLFKYTPETGRRTDIHTDSGCLSFTIALNGPDEYEGGGTWFQGLEENDEGVLEMEAGQVTFRVGGVKHCGRAVTSGTRYIIGGFCLHRRKPETVRLLLADPDDRAGLEAAVVLNPNCDPAYNMLAHAYEQQQDVARAQQVLEYCRQHVNPQAAEVAYALGTIYLDQGLFRKANECLQTCLSVDADDVDALMVAAQCAAALGDAQQEQEYYRRITRTPGANPHTVAAAYCNLGSSHPDETVQIEYYRKSLELRPEKNFTTRYNLASALADRGQFQEACAVFREAIAKANGEGESEENVVKAIQALYQATARLLQTQSDASSLSREQVVQRFQEIMGADNFAKISAMAGRR